MGEYGAVRKENRLASEADFRRVRSEGTSCGHPLLVLHATPTAESTIRIGISVSKRVGGAVTRNRVRRRVRELVRARLAGLRSGWDVVFTARPPAAEASYDALGEAVDRLLTRGGLTRSSENSPTTKVHRPARAGE